MPQGGKPIQAKYLCPNCKNRTYEIWHRDGFGQNTLLETHCNQCGWCIDAEGNVKNAGRSLPELGSYTVFKER